MTLPGCSSLPVHPAAVGWPADSRASRIAVPAAVTDNADCRVTGAPEVQRLPEIGGAESSCGMLQVLVRARVHTVRGKGKSCFLVLRQRTATGQVSSLPRCGGLGAQRLMRSVIAWPPTTASNSLSSLAPASWCACLTAHVTFGLLPPCHPAASFCAPPGPQIGLPACRRSCSPTTPRSARAWSSMPQRCHGSP